MPRLVNARIDVLPIKSTPTPRVDTGTAIKDVHNETVGDHVSLSALAITYKSRVMDVLMGQLSEGSIEVAPSIKEADVFSFDKNKQSDQFLRVFDNLRRRQFPQVIVGFNDHNVSFIPKAIFDTYADLAERFFPTLWKHLICP